jgi:hypothetical protein
MPAEAPTLDNFNRADGPVGPNWTTTSGFSTPTIVSGTVTSPSGHADAYWNPTTFSSPLEIYVSISVWNHELDLGYCTANPGALATRSGYALSVVGGSGAAILYRIDAGVLTDIGGFLYEPFSGDQLRVRLVNGVHTMHLNDIAMAAPFDSAYTTGFFTLHIGSTLDRWDDFGGGSVVAGTVNPINRLGRGSAG